MIDLLLDQGLPRSAVAALRSKGYSASHVAEIGLSEAKDIEIIECYDNLMIENRWRNGLRAFEI